MRYLKSRNAVVVPAARRQVLEWWDRGHGLNHALSTEGLPEDLEIQMRVAAKRNVIYNCAPFRYLALHGGEEGNRAILELCDELHTRLYDEGSCVICEGEEGFECYFITYGFVSVTTKAAGELNKLRKGRCSARVSSWQPPYVRLRPSARRAASRGRGAARNSYFYLMKQHRLFKIVQHFLNDTNGALQASGAGEVVNAGGSRPSRTRLRSCNLQLKKTASQLSSEADEVSKMEERTMAAIKKPPLNFDRRGS